MFPAGTLRKPLKVPLWPAATGKSNFITPSSQLTPLLVDIMIKKSHQCVKVQLGGKGSDIGSLQSYSFSRWSSRSATFQDPAGAVFRRVALMATVVAGCTVMYGCSGLFCFPATVTFSTLQLKSLLSSPSHPPGACFAGSIPFCRRG